MFKSRLLNLVFVILAGVFFVSSPLQKNSTTKFPNKAAALIDLDASLPAEEMLPLHLEIDFLPQVPPGKWSQTGNCLPACFAMLHAHAENIRPTPEMIMAFDDWAAENKGRPHNNYSGFKKGYSMQLLSEYAETLGSATAVISNGNLPILLELLREGKPVLVSVKRRMDATVKNRHAMVVVGIDAQNVYMHDPGRSAGGNYSYPLAKFIRVWRSGNNRMFHL